MQVDTAFRCLILLSYQGLTAVLSALHILLAGPLPEDSKVAFRTLVDSF